MFYDITISSKPFGKFRDEIFLSGEGSKTWAIGLMVLLTTYDPVQVQTGWVLLSCQKWLIKLKNYSTSPLIYWILPQDVLHVGLIFGLL